MNEYFYTTARYLVYCLIDPFTSEVRYVGKSSRGVLRIREHFGIKGRNACGYAKMWLRKLHSQNAKPIVLILNESGSEKDVLENEIRVIKLFRESGFDLLNITDGGEGTSGRILSVDQRMKISRKLMGHPSSDKVRAAVSMANKGRKMLPHVKAALIAANKGRKPSAETVKKMHDALRAKPISPDTRKKMSAGMRARWNDPHYRAKTSTAHTGYKMPEDQKKKIAEAVTRHYFDLTGKTKQQRIREYRRRPDVKMSQMMRMRIRRALKKAGERVPPESVPQ
jgi:hypothetical protein